MAVRTRDVRMSVKTPQCTRTEAARVLGDVCGGRGADVMFLAVAKAVAPDCYSATSACYRAYRVERYNAATVTIFGIPVRNGVGVL